MRQIRDKRALITGAAGGLGRAISGELARAGAHLFLLDIDQPRLATAANDLRRFGVMVETRSCDVASPEQVSQAVKTVLAEWSTLDILVNNAGVGFYGPTTSMTAEQWDWLLAVNLRAPIQFTRELLPTLLARPEAHVLNVASICGLVAGGRFAAYHTSKFGLVGFSEALRAEYGRQGLGVTALCPGPVRTDLYRSSPCGHRHKATPVPPGWVCTSEAKVARRALRAIRRDERQPLVGLLAHALAYAKRLSPGLLDAVQRFGRRRRLRQKAAQYAELQAADRRPMRDTDSRAA